LDDSGVDKAICIPLSRTMIYCLLRAMAAMMSDQQFETFGWRIPFLLSIFLIVLGAYLRSRVAETRHVNLGAPE
jgi:NADH:ubiquinone oxidoreductase subunit H